MALLKKPISSSLMNIQLEKSETLLQGGRFVVKSGDLRAGFKSKNLLYSLAFAFEGLMYATKTQRNFRIHLCMAVVALTLAVVLQISVMEWALLWAMIGVVLFAELVNTALELFVDMLTEGRYDLRAKAIKDMAAGAVFVTAISALACGVCIFVPHLVAVIPPQFLPF